MTDDADLLPVGTAHITAGGDVVRVNRTLADMVGEAPESLVGRNLLEFAVGDVDRYAELLAFGTSYARADMGPVEVGYRRADDGTVHRARLWARNHLDGPEGTIALVLVPATADADIAAALAAVAAGAGTDAALDRLAEAATVNPFNAVGCWLVRDQGGARLAAADSLPEGVRAALAKPGSWWDALRSPTLITCDDTGAEAGQGAHRLLRTAGVGAWWARSIEGTGTAPAEVEAAMVVIRTDPGAPSPNQVEYLERIVTVARLAIERAAMEARLAHAAFHDPLTGLANRGRFFDRPISALVGGTALLYVDLDRFKAVNDELGHAAGDLVLVAVADRLARAVRPTDRIVRLGGDEFVVECHAVASDDEAVAVAERIIDAVREPIGVDGTQVVVGASVGIARSEEPVDVDALLDRADVALRAAKRAGRDRWHLAD